MGGPADAALGSALFQARRSLLAQLFQETRIACEANEGNVQGLVTFHEEEALVVDASSTRLIEFRNGRACARAALTKLGLQPSAILRRRDREPAWPSNVVGSITHTTGFCAAAVALSEDYGAIGLDAEIDEPISAQFAERVCSMRELQRCSEHGPAHDLATVMFSIKETIHKLQYPSSGVVMYWRDLDVQLEDRRFMARLTTGFPPFPAGFEVSGRWLRDAGLVLTGAAIESATLTHLTNG